MAETIPAPLRGKVAIVTGGSRGIGAWVAEIFAKQGVTHLATTYSSIKVKAEAVLDGIKKSFPDIKTFTMEADVCDPGFGKKVIDECMKGLGVDHIDIVVSNAAPLNVEDWKPIAEMSHEQWSRLITGLTWYLSLHRLAELKH
jgi:3-oxoacyl-[acyl-carrier protein] reductase